jgi:hypothetical protein
VFTCSRNGLSSPVWAVITRKLKLQGPLGLLKKFEHGFA